jgi:hypothetical protein
MRSRKFLALLFCLVTFPAIAGYMTLLGAGVGNISPTVSWVAGADAFPSSILTIARASNATYFNSSGILSTAGNDTARIDYDPNTLAVKGLLIEEARTNYAVQSTGLTTATWALQNATRAIGATSPDGTANALTLTSSGGSIAQLYQNLTGAPTGAVTNSIFVRAGTSPYIWLQVFDNVTSSIVYVRTSDMTITSTTGGATSSITMLSNGWYRLTIGRTIAVAGAYLAFGVADASGSTVSTAAYTGLFYGPDHGAGSFDTSYIPTAAASVTRAADVVQFTGPALTALQGAAASILVEVGGVPAYGEIVGSNQLRMQVDPAAPYYNGYYAPDNLIINPSAGALSTTFRAGSAWSASGKRAALNGLALASNNNAATPITGAVTLGSTLGTYYINSWVKSFAIYNQRLPDAALQAKSVVGASYAANDNGIRYAFANNDNLPIHWRIAL